jgi:hypothetical protein
MCEVGILPTKGKHLHDSIISLRGEDNSGYIWTVYPSSNNSDCQGVGHIWLMKINLYVVLKDAGKHKVLQNTTNIYSINIHVQCT